MKKILLFIFAITMIFSCKKPAHLKNNLSNSNTGTSLPDSSARYNNNADNNQNAGISSNELNISNAFYEKTPDALVITLWGNNGNKIFVYSSVDTPGKLDNRSFITNEKGTFYASNGVLNYSFNTDSTISGNFSMKAVSPEDSSVIDISNVNFQNVKPAKNFSHQNKFVSSKIVDINTQEGSIKETNANTEISIDDQNIIFKNTNNQDNTFQFRISKKIEKPTSDILYTTDSEINYIFIDKIKNQITIFYSNGNNKTFM